MDQRYEVLRSDLFAHIAGAEEGTEEYSNLIKQIDALNKAESSHPETPEKGVKAWFEKHSDALIKVGGTLGTVVTIGFIESKFDVIFRSKASKYL